MPSHQYGHVPIPLTVSLQKLSPSAAHGNGIELHLSSFDLNSVMPFKYPSPSLFSHMFKCFVELESQTAVSTQN